MRLLACSGMRFEDASPRAFRLRRRTKGGYCGVLPTSVYRFGAVGLWAMRCCGVSGALMRWRRSGWSMSGCRYRCRCGRGCRCCPRRCRVLAGDSDYRVLHGVDVLLGHRVPKGVDVLGHCVKRGVGERLGNHVNQGFGGRRHRGVSSLRALTAAMRIARKRNRSPQNGAGRDDGSSQRSLL